MCMRTFAFRRRDILTSAFDTLLFSRSLLSRYTANDGQKFPSRSVVSALHNMYSDISTEGSSSVDVKLAASPFNFSADAQADGSSLVVSYATHTR